MNRMPSETRPHMTSMKEVLNDGKRKSQGSCSHLALKLYGPDQHTR